MTDHDDCDAIPLADLAGAPPGPRLREIDEAWVILLTQTDPATWSPVVVDAAGRVIDGFHRIEAAQRLGLESLRVDGRGLLTDAGLLEAAALANLHGLPLTLAQRRAVALELIRLDPSISNGRVARAVGVSKSSVAAWRPAVQSGPLDSRTAVRVGQDGKRYPVTPSTPAPEGRPPARRLGPLRAFLGRLVNLVLRWVCQGKPRRWV